MAVRFSFYLSSSAASIGTTGWVYYEGIISPQATTGSICGITASGTQHQFDPSNPINRHMEQRITWHIPPKIQILESVMMQDRYQKMFRGHLFPPGKKK